MLRAVKRNEKMEGLEVAIKVLLGQITLVYEWVDLVQKKWTQS